MSAVNSPMTAKEVLDTYFIDNRARLLEIASFLDRIDRSRQPAEGRADFRYKAFIRALETIIQSEENRTKAVQVGFSDMSLKPIESASGLKATGAWES